MKIEQIVASINQRQGDAGSQLFFQADNDFASTLTLGQTIKAKVLRHYEGSRYGVEINGQEKVVDSAIPLKPGELVEGRVKALGKQIEVQRINETLQQPRADGPDESIGQALLFNNKALKTLADFFALHQASLTAKEAALLQGMLKGQSTEALAMSALAVKKAGLELTQERIAAVMQALVKKVDKPSITTPLPMGLAVDQQAAVAQSVFSHEFIKTLADDIAAYAHSEFSQPNGFSEGDSESESDAQQQALAKHLLNTQDESAVKHQLLSFPMWLGERLVEINLALFDQPKGHTAEETTRPFKRMVFTLDLTHLGVITVSAVVHGSAISLSIGAQDDVAAEAMANYMTVLHTTVEQLGWQVDRLEYATLKPSSYEAAAESVVRHYMAKDSVSRLL